MKVSQYQTENMFDFSWKQVAIAYWNRYPNPSSAHVLTEDTICREVRDGKLYSRRLLSKTNPVPKWGERFYIKNTPVKILEDSILDPKKKTLITFTRNIGFKKIMSVDEVVEYMEVGDGRTLAVRRAYVTSQVFGFSRAIRAFGIERFKNNCHKAASGFNYVLHNMFPHHQQQRAATIMAATSATGTYKAIEDAKTITTTTTTTVNNIPITATTTQISKSEMLKNAAKSAFNFVKNNTTKLAQLFSIKN